MNYLDAAYDFNSREFLGIFDELPLWSAPFGLKLLEVVPLRNHSSILDIGFGSGFPLLELATRAGKSTIYGIDVWKAGMLKARQKADFLGLDNIVLLEAPAEQIPLPDQSIDIIVSNNGVNNVSNIPRVFAECARVAKPGAHFVFSYNLQETMLEFYTPFEQVLRHFNLLQSVGLLHEHIYHKRKPLQFMINNLQEAGFSDITVLEDSFSWHYADGSAMLNHPFIQYAFLPSWKEIVPTERRIEVFSETERRLNLITEDKGRFVLTIPFAVVSARYQGT